MKDTDENWKPGLRISRDETARAELDRHVKGIDWTDRAVEFGSPERYRVALWMQATDLVYGEMRRLYPIKEQRIMMTRWVEERVFEKITGIPMVSNSKQWNWNGLWNPLEPTSFCGWVRRVSIPLAQWNAKRVLKSKTIPASLLEEEDGDNPTFEKAAARLDKGTGIFDQWPDLKVPRPAGQLRDRLLDMATNGTDVDAIRMMRRIGLWDPSLDVLEPGMQAALMLAPLPADSETDMLDADLGLEDSLELKRLYWPTQTSRRRVWQPGLRRELTRVSRLNHVIEYETILRLGTAAARILTR
ncbi:hypothetical protein [Bifidobacterium felsineum]|uniref:hypothetical protein n=1 Tax=Bifidobacterium felsineum TaxID=2045440 RepID=UPI001BDC88AB|nr:hypothetical protein [Bifidobacterium felsineum]MBT1164559.1 hypothetical protein [Bifidobacterium felsineum]